MQKLSPYYRDDGTEGLDAEIKAYLDEHYLKNLKNLDRINPKLLVVFSGGNAMGKSTIARRIGDRLGGIVIENDEIKRHILQLLPHIEPARLNPLTWQYIMDLYRRLPELTQNGLIVRDGIIDWYYDRILPRFSESGYSIFIIAFDISRDKAIELINSRGDTPTTKKERLYALLDDHEIHMKRFRAAYTPDITLTEDNLFDHDEVMRTLEKRLKKIT